MVQSRHRSSARFSVLLFGILAGILLSVPTVRAHLVSTASIVLVSVVVMWAFASINDIEPLYIVSVYGFLLFVFVLNIPIQEITLSPDAFRYEYKAWLTAQSWWQPETDPVTYINIRVKSYSYVGAVIYFIFGRGSTALVVANVSFWAFAILCWMVITKHYLTSVGHEITGFLLVAYPAGIRYAINIVREPITHAFFALTFLFVFHWLTSERLRYLVVALVTSFGLLLIRPELVLPLWVIVCGTTLVMGPTKCRKQVVSTVFITVILGTLFFRRIRQHLPRYADPDYALDVDVLTIKQAPPPGQRTYLEAMEYTSWQDVISTLPTRLYHFMIAPLQFIPDQWSLFSKAGLDAVFVVIMSVLAIIGVGLLLVHWTTGGFNWAELRVYIVLVLSATTVASGYSITVSSTAAVRRRSFIVPIVIVFAAIAVGKFIDRVRDRFEIRLSSFR